MITYGSTTLTSYNTITKIEVYYYKSISATSLSGGSWSTTKPTWESGKYIWQKIRTTYEGKLDNGQTFSESDPVNITGQQGATGISAYSYKLTVSDTIVSVSKNGTYSTNSVTFSATSKQGDGNVNAYLGRFKIETTADGITWTTQYTSSANESSKTFTIPENITNIRCSLYQAGGTTVLLDITSVSIVRDGTDATGLKDSIPFYLASDKETGITIYDEGWSTLRPALDATNKYLWVYYLSRYSDGTTDPELIEVFGDITTFENNGDVSPIYNTEVEINPIQDLNGFDHAWNGGDGKNLLAYPYYTGDTHTSNGITFTVEKYSNGAIKDVLVNGTASALTFFNFSGWGSAKTDLSKYTGQSLIISGGTNNARISVQYRLPNSTSNKTLANDAGTGATFTVPDASDLGTWAIFISISNGTVLNNVRVYPMLRFASETDGTYEPYENICPIDGWNSVKIERTGKNLLGIKYPNRTNNGITFTVNGSKITANGTATANAWSSANLSGITSNLQYKNLIPPGQYMLTGGKSTDKRLYITGHYLNGKGITIVNDYGNGALYTLTDWAYVYPQVQITSGTTVENEVFNIQLEATTTTTEYEPYCGNTYEIDFPTEAGTIFKGKLIIDENGDGQLIQTHKSIILDNTNKNGYNLYSPNIRPYWIIDDKALFSSYIEANNHIYTDSCVISHSGVINSPQNAKVQALSAYTTKVVYVILINITTQEAMDAYLANHPIQLVYELAEPIIYHLTAKQILAVLKTNHIYANTGNTTVKYYDNQKVTEPYIDYSATSAFEYSAEALDKIDNLEIGGRNLLRISSMSNQDASISNNNTNFTEYFRRYNGNASQHTFEKIADGVYQDTIALNTSGNLGVAFGRLVSEFNFDYTSEYTLSCWAKCTKENAHLDIGLSYYKNNDTWVWRGGTNPQNFKEINKWQFFKLTFKPDADTKAICYCFTVKGETNGIDSFTIRNCKLEKGNKPTDWSPAPEDVENSIKAYTESIQSQVDGMAEIHYGTVAPTLSNAPYTSWGDTATRDMHVDDLYYNTSTGYCYRFIKSGSTYLWTRIKDSDITAAATAASNANTAAGNAQTTANNANTLAGQKRRIFVATPTTPYEVGDLWVEGSNGDIKKCKTARATGSYTASDWELASKYTDDTLANEANDKIDNLEIGGRNLLKNSKALTTNWALNQATVADGIVTITPTISADRRMYQMPANGYWTWTIGQEYTVSVAARSDNGASFYFQANGAGKGSSSIPVTSDWQRYSFTFIATSASTSSMAFSIIEASGKTIQFKEPKLEYGGKATDWTPAPEDTQADIDTAIAQSNIALEQSVEYIVGTQTGSTGTWTGVTTDIELKVGKTIAYKLPYAGNGNASLVLTLADGSTTDAIPVYLNTTRVTTHFGANSVINMTYDGQYWRASSIPNSNTYDRRQHNGAIKAKVAISKYHLIGGNSTGYQHINASTPFDFGYPILYASGDIKVNETAASTYEAYPNINFTYTGTIQEGGANKMLWLKGSINGNLFTPASSNYLTTIIPTSDDGMYYIPLGVMTSAINGYFSSSNRIYGYVDDMFQPLDNAAVLRAQSAKNFATATYGLCDTEATTSEKIVECPNFVLFEGARIQIAFTYANTEAIPTLNINNTGVKNIKIGIVECSDANPLYWGSDTQIEFVYDGTNWIIQNAPMTLYGVCSTEQNIAEKIVMCDGAVVCKGTIMYVSMNYSNTAANASLNVADIGAIIINANNEPLSMPSRFNWNAETNPCFTFDGQCWQMDNDTVSAYITDTNDNGIFIHPIDDMSSGWSIGSAIQLFKENIDYIKLWLENTIAKIRIGREDQGHIILDNESVIVNGIKDEELKELASFSSIGITFDDKTPYKIGNDEAYIQFVDTDEDGVADSLEIVADNISFRNNTSIQNELNVLQNKTDKTSDSLQGVINELNDKDYETRVTQLETNAVERNKYININPTEPSITIATEQGQNNTSLKLQSDKLSFINNNNETAYMANDKMNIPTASITNLFMQSVDNSTEEVFEKLWVMRSNGHLSLKAVKRGE